MLKIKPDTLLIAAAAGMALWFVARIAKGQPLSLFKSTAPAPTSNGAARTNAVNNTYEITNTATPGQTGWGWKYYSDGTSIGPDGRYYSGGSEVYNPSGMLTIQG
ncbi:MAG: hypothetical protein WA174_14705 [Rhodoferax sp.]